MGGRHRSRRRNRRVWRLLAATVPVIGAAGITAVVVLGGGALAGPSVTSPPPAPIAAASAGPPVPQWLREAATPAPLAGVVAGASDAVAEQRERARQEKERRDATQKARSAGAATCDLEGPPRFDDPAHPNEITNRDCGYVDGQGRERSHDPWIDGQLLSSYGE